MTAKELSEIFEEIERELIANFKRNFTRHKSWEKAFGFDWPAWQAKKIKSMERFRRENEEIIGKYSDVISAETRKMLLEQYAEGENKALEELLNDNSLSAEVSDDSFFEIFDEKIESLIEEVQGKETTAEKSALRMMDDVYRQTILKADFAVQTGSMTVQQAVELAVKDFARQGINSIEYKDGRRVNIADYAYMALQTSNTRAGLYGGAKQRAALGIDTVSVSQYHACSPTCQPWQGKNYIDDVYGVFDGETYGDKGKSKNGKWYLLLSVAVEAGLFHPNCRHTLISYKEGCRDFLPIDGEETRRRYKLEQQQRALERKVRKWKRMLEASDDPVWQETYKKKVREAQKDLREFIKENSDVLRRDPWREKIYKDSVEKSVKSDIIRGTESFANAPSQNTGRKLIYNADSDFSVSIDGYSDTVNKSISSANAEVARLGGTTNKEYLIMVDVNTGAHSYYEGGENEMYVGGKNFWEFLKNNPNEKYAFVHNHNTDGFFSETDMRTLLSCDNIEAFVAVRLDGISYVTIKNKKLVYNSTFDKLYERELKEINNKVRNGEITAGERTRLREEIIVNNLIKDYTKGLIIFENGKRLG